jgi:hypothetical protein
MDCLSYINYPMKIIIIEHKMGGGGRGGGLGEVLNKRDGLGSLESWSL